MRAGDRRPRLEQQRRRSRSASDGSSDGSGSGSASDSDSQAQAAGHPGGEEALGDAALSEMLSKRRVRHVAPLIGVSALIVLRTSPPLFVKYCLVALPWTGRREEVKVVVQIAR